MRFDPPESSEGEVSQRSEGSKPQRRGPSEHASRSFPEAPVASGPSFCARSPLYRLRDADRVDVAVPKRPEVSAEMYRRHRTSPRMVSQQGAVDRAEPFRRCARAVVAERRCRPSRQSNRHCRGRSQLVGPAVPRVNCEHCEDHCRGQGNRRGPWHGPPPAQPQAQAGDDIGKARHEVEPDDESDAAPADCRTASPPNSMRPRSDRQQAESAAITATARKEWLANRVLHVAAFVSRLRPSPASS